MPTTAESVAPPAAPPRRRAGVAVAVGVAAAAMVATLPGRTHGLGLITEPLLRDLAIDRVPFAALNLWATLIGAAFCLPVGWLLDRVGVRVVLTVVLAALGVVVVAIAHVTAGGSARVELLAVDEATASTLGWAGVPLGLFLLVLLTRGLGQSALSVVSLALMGKAAGRKPGAVVGVYSFLVAVGFMAVFRALMGAFTGEGGNWREVWAGIGWVLIAGAVLAAVVVREPRPAADGDDGGDGRESLTLGRSLATPAFWVFGLATSFYGMVAAGLSLFNQSVLAERGFDRDVFLTITAVTPLVGLAANLAAGWLARSVRLGYLMAAGMLIMGAALAAFPSVRTLTEVYAYAAAMGVAGGVITVVFFSAWAQGYGPVHLGKIQGVAQLLTVLASAAGPLILAVGHRASGAYAPLIQQLAGVSVAFAVAAVFTPLPTRNSPDRTGDPA